MVKSSNKTKDSLKQDGRKLLKDFNLYGELSVKNSVSDIKISLDFERRSVSMSIKVLPPLDRGSISKITWISKQLESCKKKSESTFLSLYDYLWIEADIKYARANLKVKLSEVETLKEDTKKSEIQAFHVVLSDGFGSRFSSTRKFIELLDEMVLSYYEGIVQNMTNWSRPAPKLEVN